MKCDDKNLQFYQYFTLLMHLIIGINMKLVHSFIKHLCNMKSLLPTIFLFLCFHGVHPKTIDKNKIVNRADNFVININEYADKIFANLQQLIISKNLNIVALPNATLKLKPTGTLDLTAGYLQDLDTLSRSGDIDVSYDHANRKLSSDISIKFGDLRFSYNYHSKVTFISSHGRANGTVKNIKVNAKISFDFETYEAALEHYDMQHTGDISVKFHGNKVVDWLLDAMTAVFSVFFHPLIIGQIQKLIRDNLRDIVEKLNEIMRQNLHPSIM